MTRYEEHGVRPGVELTRLTITRPDGSTYVGWYRYSTSAYHTEDHLKSEGFMVVRDRAPWDGTGYVCTDNGD